MPRGCALWGLVVVLCSTVAFAQPPTDLERAKQLFREANALRLAGDCGRAIDKYRASRELYPSVPNTLNAAICLERLGRLDEALEMYETLIATLADELADDDRRPVTAEMTRLRARVGTISIRTNVTDAEVVIDARSRGTLVGPLRVTPGERSVRVLRDGYAPFDQSVLVVAGQDQTIDAQLEPLLSGGKLKVDGPPGATIYIDGSPVGTAPWQGLLAAGRHLYYLRQDGPIEQGMAPRSVLIVPGQTALAEVELMPLGPPLSLSLEPQSAELSIDGVAIGRGGWQGRLPLGAHELEVREVGYRTADSTLVVTADSAREHVIFLERDDDHPRWRTPGAPIWMEAYGGLALSAGLGSDAEAACAARPCNVATVALGWHVGARVGYELVSPLSLEVAGGVASLSLPLRRIYRAGFANTGEGFTALSYELEDNLSIVAPWIGGGIALRQPLLPWLSFHSHLVVGGMFPQARDEIGGTVSGNGRTLQATVEGSGSSQSAVQMVVIPELRLAVTSSQFFASLGLKAMFMLLNGPIFADHGDVTVIGGACDGSDPIAVDCAPGRPLVAGERSYGPTVVFVPGLSVGYAF